MTSKATVEELAKDYLDTLKVFSKNEFNSIPLAFIAGYNKAIEQDKWIEINDVINYIENDAEIAIPIDDLMGENGMGLTKKDYGLVLLKHLVIELRNRFLLTPRQTASIRSPNSSKSAAVNSLSPLKNPTH